MVFYKAKNGDTGAIYSVEIPGGNEGNLDNFPHIALGENGLTESEESFEKINLGDLSSFEELYFVVCNYGESSLGNKIDYNEFKGNLVITSNYSDVSLDNTYLLNLSSEEKKDVLILAKLEICDNRYMLENMNKVMTFDNFRETIPGATNFNI